jgi:alkyl hydroperoxide reductase subunit AhpC/predicted ester cyclase
MGCTSSTPTNNNNNNNNNSPNHPIQGLGGISTKRNKNKDGQPNHGGHHHHHNKNDYALLNFIPDHDDVQESVFSGDKYGSGKANSALESMLEAVNKAKRGNNKNGTNTPSLGTGAGSGNTATKTSKSSGGGGGGGGGIGGGGGGIGGDESAPSENSGGGGAGSSGGEIPKFPTTTITSSPKNNTTSHSLSNNNNNTATTSSTLPPLPPAATAATTTTTSNSNVATILLQKKLTTAHSLSSSITKTSEAVFSTLSPSTTLSGAAVSAVEDIPDVTNQQQKPIPNNSSRATPTPTTTATTSATATASKKRDAIRFVSQVHTLQCRGRIDDVCRLGTPEMEILFRATGKTYKGRAGFREYLFIMKNAFPDLTITHVRDFVDGDTVICECLWSGTNTGWLVFPSHAFPPTSRHIQDSYFTEMYTLSKGKISNIVNYQDTESWISQLGLNMSTIANIPRNMFRKPMILGDELLDLGIVCDGSSATSLYQLFPSDEWFLIFAHPMAGGPVSTTELVEIGKRLDEFVKRRIGVSILSPGSLSQHQEWRRDVEWLLNNNVTATDNNNNNNNEEQPQQSDFQQPIQFGVPFICDSNRAVIRALNLDQIQDNLTPSSGNTPVSTVENVSATTTTGNTLSPGGNDSPLLLHNALSSKSLSLGVIGGENSLDVGANTNSNSNIIPPPPTAPTIPATNITNNNNTNSPIMSARTLFIFGPGRKLKASLTYPVTSGISVEEVIRLIDSLQTTYTYKLSTPANWKLGQDCLLLVAMTEADALARYKCPIQTIPLISGKPILRYVASPQTIINNINNNV